jgi:hypothetical protein
MGRAILLIRYYACNVGSASVALLGVPVHIEGQSVLSAGLVMVGVVLVLSLLVHLVGN